MPVATIATLALVGLAALPGGSGAPLSDSRGAGGRVHLRLEGPLPQAVATLAESDLRTAFGRRGVDVTRREGPAMAAASASEMVLTVVASNERLDQIALTLEGAGVSPLNRRLNLTALPADGRMLALVVAADEMLVATIDERQFRTRSAARARASEPASVPGPTPPPPASAPAPAGAATAPAPERPTETETRDPSLDKAQTTDKTPDKISTEPPATPLAGTVATAATSPPVLRRWDDSTAAVFAFDHFAGGQTHLGLDLAWRRRLGSRAYLVVAAQGRRGSPVSTGGGTVGSRLLGGRLAAGLGLVDDGGPLWLAVDVGARAGRLWFEGHPDDGFTGHDFGTFVAYADAMLTLDVRLGATPVALRLALGAGLPLLAQVAATRVATKDSIPVTAASGAAFESEAGVVLSF